MHRGSNAGRVLSAACRPAVSAGPGSDGPLPPIPYGHRRDRLFTRLGDGAMVLPAAPVRFRSGDSEYRYRADSELLYLTGWDLPDGIALFRGFADEDRFVLFVPERDPARELWTGRMRDPDEARTTFGADRVFPFGDFPTRAPRLLAGGDGIWYRLGASEACDRVVREALRAGRSRRPRDGTGPWRLVDPGAILDGLRLRKDAAEIARMRRAAKITVAAFREALPKVREGVGEWEVEAALEFGFRSRGANGPAFTTIVAAGVNACTLHYSANDSRVGADDLVLVDAGADYDGYAADITRTVPASGRLEGVRREVYEVVRERSPGCAGRVQAAHDSRRDSRGGRSRGLGGTGRGWCREGAARGGMGAEALPPVLPAPDVPLARAGHARRRTLPRPERTGEARARHGLHRGAGALLSARRRSGAASPGRNRHPDRGRRADHGGGRRGADRRPSGGGGRTGGTDGEGDGRGGE